VLSRSAFFILCLFPGVLPFACSGTDIEKDIDVQKDFILEEKDLVPEGVAFDPVTSSIFVSSTHKRKIVRIDSAGVVSDFIIEKQDGIWSTIGMEVDAGRGHLWVVSSQAKEVLPLLDPDSLQWRSAIYQYNLQTSTLIDSCLLRFKKVFLNDLTVAQNGDVYITESMQGGIYCLKSGTDSLELFLAPAPYTFPNGIYFSDQPGKLFVSVSEGILKVDLASRRYDLLRTSDSINAKEIDGLTFYKGSLIAHQSTKLVRFILNDKQDSIIHATVLNEGSEFDTSTNGETENDDYYFIVNSQIRSGIDLKKQALSHWTVWKRSLSGRSLYKSISIMSRNIAFAYMTTVAIVFCGCRNNGIFDKKKETQAITALLFQERKAHFDRNVDLFLSEFADSMISVNKGKVSVTAPDENRERISEYFGRVEFVKWDDVAEPVIRFSDDGSLCYAVIQKQVILSSPDSLGRKRMDTTDFAWASVYRKQRGKWKVECNVSTNK
jgi:hypothetical protein